MLRIRGANRHRTLGDAKSRLFRSEESGRATEVFSLAGRQATARGAVAARRMAQTTRDQVVLGTADRMVVTATVVVATLRCPRHRHLVSLRQEMVEEGVVAQAVVQEEVQAAVPVAQAVPLGETQWRRGDSSRLTQYS